MFYLLFLPISSVYSAVSDTSLLPFRDATVVKLDVFGEARCPDTTRLVTVVSVLNSYRFFGGQEGVD